MLELVVRREQKNVNFDEICVSLAVLLQFSCFEALSLSAAQGENACGLQLKSVSTSF